MRWYRITLDVYDVRTNTGDRVVLLRQAISPEYATRDIGTVYVSADGRTVNRTGGVGRDGHSYMEWSVVSVRLSRAAAHR